MSDVFISYARSTADQARKIGEALRSLGYAVWRDDELPAHRAYADVIEERLKAAKAVVVVWSADAARSHWVRAEADAARQAGTLVQLTADGAAPPLPFNQIQCAEMAGWSGDLASPGWKKVAASVAELVGSAPTAAPAAIWTPAAETAPALLQKPSIAVLPFAAPSRADEGDYFADGMVEAITAALSRFPSLFVISSGSTLTYRGSNQSPQQIARDLRVRSVVNGSVRRSADNIRIAVRLIDAAEGAQVWSETYDGRLQDVFDLHDRAANSVAAQVEPALLRTELRRAALRPTRDLGAYDLYLRARHAFQGWSKPSFSEALRLLHAAISRDPTFGAALAFASGVSAMLVFHGWADDPATMGSVSLDLGQRALRLADDDAEALAWVASAILHVSGDQPTAEALIERALELNPGAAFAWMCAGYARLHGGAPEAALERFETTSRLDPKSEWRPTIRAGLALSLFFLGRSEEALVPLREAMRHRPGFGWWASLVLAAALAELGRVTEARAALEGVAPGSPIQSFVAAFPSADQQARLRANLSALGVDI